MSLFLKVTKSIPKQINLLSAYPNPFNPTINFDIEINSISDIELSIHSMNGKLVDVLYSGNINPGNYQFSWDGSSYSSGIYIVTLKTYNSQTSRKILYLK